MNDFDDLLTLEAKIARIKEMLPAHKTRGRFLLPDDSFYAAPRDDAGLKSMSRILCMWIGFKPVGLDIRFTDELEGESSMQTQDNGRLALLINRRHAHNAYACAALLANNLVRYFIEHRKRFKLRNPAEQEVFVIVSTIYAGLGVIMLNYSSSVWQQRYPAIYAWLNRNKPAYRSHIRTAGYVNSFAQDYRIEADSFALFLCPWAPWPITSERRYHHQPAGYVNAARGQARQASTALIASIMVIAAGMLLSGYVIGQRPDTLPLVLRQEREEIDILKNSYELCEQSVNKKQSAYNQNDFFIQRSLDAERARCISLRNLYNYRVDQYNKQLSP